MRPATPPDRWRQISHLYHAALARKGDPAAFLEEACAGDEGLRLEVASLLAQPASAAEFFAEPAVVMAAQLVDDPGAALIGRRLGVYQIQAFLGAGGMGEVYRARDAKLGREVALKILPAAFVADPARCARFEREARLLASLNHPNIAHIHGLEESGGVRALVMELVEGEDLSQRIARGAIPLDEVLPIAKQVAEALEAAHEQGIIHRDLKPANIKVRSDGTVKVLDFGLAKAMAPAQGSSPDLSHSPTITTPAMTQAGMILGTAAYMSPEQAKGSEADKRSDVWAFGAVLYEMLTGRRAFDGEDTVDVLSRVLQREPDWVALPAGVSPTLVLYLKRCLYKDSKQRLGDIHDMRLALEGAFETAELQTTASATATPRRRMARMAAFVVAVLGMVTLAFLTARYLRETPPPAPPETRTEIVAGATNDPTSFALSPDGQQIVFVAAGDGASRLWLRSLATTTAQPLSGTEGATAPFWSPDGRSIGFFADNALKRLDFGGAVRVLTPVNGGAAGRGTRMASFWLLMATPPPCSACPPAGAVQVHMSP
jgi:serine/threonine protein kinase